MTLAAALILEDVCKTFGSDDAATMALSHVSMQARAGTICGLIGPDGAGKSTLMRLAAGLLLPESGQFQVLGMDTREEALQIQTVVGYMPQRFGLYEDLSVQENLDLYADLQGVSGQQRQTRYAELMHMTALAPFKRRLAGNLSGGMKQKLGLACALVSTPRLLLLDEPTAGVDPVSRRELWAIINRLVKQDGITVLLSTAYLDEAERCDDIVLLHEGRVLGQGSPQQFSDSMYGRIFHIDSAQIGRRQLQQRISSLPEVVDAVIDNEKVRVVMRDTAVPDWHASLADITDLHTEAVQPVFEDAFVATLKQTHTTTPLAATAVQSVSSANGTMIEVHDVQKRFGQFYAVKGISFSVRQGEIFGLLGANGAGKSTTFRMLCGLLPASAGELTVAGRDLRRATAEARSRLGYMAQRFSLYANLTVMENLNFFASAYGLGRRQRRQRIDWAMATFELETHRNASSGDLPLGFKQRLAMAAALLHEPDILFLDEPTSGVDPLARREFWERINALAEAGVTVLVTTHFMAEADYCDRLVIMAEGEVLAEGTPSELKARFRTQELPSPTMEDTFIGLVMDRRQSGGIAA